MGKIPGRPASSRPAGLALPKKQPRLRTSDNVTQSRGSKSRVRPWFNWKHRKAPTPIQRSTRQPKITKIAGTYFPGDYPRAEQGLGQVRGRDGCKDRWSKRGGELGLFQISKTKQGNLNLCNASKAQFTNRLTK